ncbi:transglutaminase-like domain-containing protein [Dysosmobacter sp.]|uniref:transglutaminase-like domain-containing protein n=1 Tax=Dysosmobacter sp. TaxID=2591382 RepID=UPI002A8829A7|nr:transglutaminase-like domain-containing protein [Dysosmobacter sp.]MDY3282026.1 transglutaminase-like domain-containing protein [Dysosmobacter sp.]
MISKKHCLTVAIAVVLLLGSAAGGVRAAALPEGFAGGVYLPQGIEVPEEDGAMELIIPEERAPLAADAVPAVSTLLMPEASGVKVHENQKAGIDYSNTADGYVMARYTESSEKKVKLQVKGPTTTYTYDLKPGDTTWNTFPLSDGDGHYTVTIYQNISGNRYSSVMAVNFSVTLKNEFAPFLRPNQYVNYAVSAENTVARAAALCAGLTDPLDKVKAVYEYVVTNFKYDYDLANSVQSGYLPVLDTVLDKQKGICFDYAAVMTAMLRCQGVPCKLVVGYAGTIYHAWINVWTEESGWVNAAIYFDGVNWQRMDPTFASTGRQSREIMQYIGDGKNYTAKYLY